MCEEYKQCSKCDGDGWVGVKTKRIECPGCGGLGRIPHVEYWGASHSGDLNIVYSQFDTCSQCNGNRYIIVPNDDGDRTECSKCEGTGDENYPRREEARRQEELWAEIKRREEESEREREDRKRQEEEDDQCRRDTEREEYEERKRGREEEERRVSEELDRKRDELIEEQRQERERRLQEEEEERQRQNEACE